ncbi:MAG: hypothetical protein K2N72_01720 [Oscillospiraceae bacterium]|nr:hypothetical protein [Oscillospiraceae bacterium]
MAPEICSADNMLQIFDESLLAVAALCKSGKIIYKNKAFSKAFGNDPPLSREISVTGPAEQYITTDNISYRLYITPVGEHIIVAAVPDRESRNISDKEIMTDIFAWERHMLSNIIIAADNIAMENSGETISGALSAIETSAMDYHSKMSVTEQAYELSAKSFKEFETVNISQTVSEYAADLTRSLANYPVKVTVSSRGGLFSRCDFKSVRMLLSDFAGRAMTAGEMPESFKIDLSDTPDNRMILSVVCKFGASPPLQSDGMEMNSAYTALAELLAEKCDCIITEQTLGNTVTFSINMPECFDRTKLCAPVSTFRFDTSSKRFSDINTALCAYGLNPSYPIRKDNKNEQ